MALPWSFVSKNTNSKHQIPDTMPKAGKNHKFQYPMTKTLNDKTLFGFWNFGYWNLFDIWDFKNSMKLQHSKSLPGITKAGLSGPGYLYLQPYHISTKLSNQFLSLDIYCRLCLSLAEIAFLSFVKHPIKSRC